MGVVWLFYLNFLVYILIYSPAPLILTWEFRNFFGAPTVIPSHLSLSLSLSLSVTEHTYSNNKMTSCEMKNRFIRICLFVSYKGSLKSAGIQVALSLPFATLVSLPCSYISVCYDLTLLYTMTFCRNSPSSSSTLNISATCYTET